MTKTIFGLLTSLLLNIDAWGQRPPLLPEKDVAAIAGEISGETAKRNLEGIAQYHRQRGSKGFHAAAELVAGKLREDGLSDVAILQFPADGAIFYGTQRSRPAWDAQEGDLYEVVKDTASVDCKRAAQDTIERMHGPGYVGVLTVCMKSIASYAAMPVAVAEDSESADVMADLVDVGEGTKDSDYAGKEVKGKIVMVSTQPGAVQDLAVGKFGAVGIVSYAQNQKTAWWGENVDAVRWGHLETFSTNKTFAFMVSLKHANAMREWMSLGKDHYIRLHAVVKAGQHPGYYEVVTATIPGADAKLKEEEIAFSCHLDHQRPGANDNASGCATILEVARMLQKLIAAGKLARPARTIRFIFPPEIEGTMALLNSDYDSVHPLLLSKNPRTGGDTFKEPFYKRIKAVIHMDMVGGRPETKAVFHVTRGPMSLPSFVQDVAWAFAEWVNGETYQYAATGKAEYPLVSPEGGKEPLRAEYSAYTMGSDHDVYQDSSFGIPAIYLNDWPDRFIHTNLDAPANIDATKLKRAGFIGAASGYFLAVASQENLPVLSRMMELNSLRLAQEIAAKRTQVDGYEGGEIQRFEGTQLRPLVESMTNFLHLPFNNGVPALAKMGQNLDLNGEGMSLKTITGDEDLLARFSRVARLKGPMAVFGYDYFEAEWTKRGRTTKPKLLEHEGLWGGGEEYAYEVLNFADGKRSAQEIRDAVSAEYGPVPVELVVEYLKALEEIGVVERIEGKK